MRISTNQIINPYKSNLDNIQADKLKNQLRLSTGKYITETADDPPRMVKAKKLNAFIDNKESYINSIDGSIEEITAAEEKLNAMGEKLQKIRDIAVDASVTGNTGNLHSLGIYVEGILNDLVRDANADFNGHYLFSGTKTTPRDLNKTPEASNDDPFELFKGERTAENPSGYEVVFKGNNKDRIVNKDELTVETINAKAADMFGGDGADVFDSIINLYNLLAYNSDGEKRDKIDVFNKSDIGKLDQYQKEIADTADSIHNVTSQLGAKYKYLDVVKHQLENENLLLKDFRSKAEDADVARTSLELMKTENALQYALQISSSIIRPSLFDFIRL